MRHINHTLSSVDNRNVASLILVRLQLPRHLNELSSLNKLINGCVAEENK